METISLCRVEGVAWSYGPTEHQHLNLLLA